MRRHYKLRNVKTIPIILFPNFQIISENMFCGVCVYIYKDVTFLILFVISHSSTGKDLEGVHPYTIPDTSRFLTIQSIILEERELIIVCRLKNES